MNYRPRLTALLAGSLLLVCAAGCRRLGNSADTSGLNAIRYHVQGVVLGKSPLNQEVTLEQAPVPKRMPATSAVYRISDSGLFRDLQTGDTVAGEAILPADGGEHELDGVMILSELSNPRARAALPPHTLLEGELVPSIPMVNEDRREVELTQFRGKAILVTFVDTQCTEDCPIITKLFGRVDHLLSQNPQVYQRSQPITVSLDPAHDTPPVLRRYGLQYLHGNKSGFDHWEFVTLTPDNLHRLATSFGVMYQASRGGDIVHTIDVSLIGPNNTLIKSWEGDDWNPSVIAKAVDAAVLGQSS